MFTSRCENATQQRHCCSRPTVVIARPAVRLAAASCFLKPQGPCGHGQWVCAPRADVIVGGGEESTLICWQRVNIGRGDRKRSVRSNERHTAFANPMAAETALLAIMLSSMQSKPSRPCQASPGALIRRKRPACRQRCSCVSLRFWQQHCRSIRTAIFRFGRILASRILIPPALSG
jgi:hypothetical protein